MRNSSNALILVLLSIGCLFMLVLIVYQKALLELVSQRLTADPSAGLPVSSTPITGFSFPTSQPAAPVGKELTAGNLAITVRRVVRPADTTVGDAGLFNTLEQDEQYLLVDIQVRCLSTTESCRLTEFDFGVRTGSGRDYTAEFSSGFDEDLKGLFEGGEIEPGKSLAGALIFVIHKTDTDLKLLYPRMYNFGGSAEFLLGR
jgi:hypothetical protein